MMLPIPLSSVFPLDVLLLSCFSPPPSPPRKFSLQIRVVMWVGTKSGGEVRMLAQGWDVSSSAVLCTLLVLLCFPTPAHCNRSLKGH